MFKNMSIKAKLIVVVTGTIFIVSTLLALTSIYSLKEISSQNIESFKKQTYKEQKDALQNYSEMAKRVISSYHERSSEDKIKNEVRSYIDEQSDFLFSIINRQYELYKGKMGQEELKKLIINTVDSTRYGKSGYFWINDFNYKMIMHPIKKELSGKYFKETPKVPFVQLGADELKKTGKDRGYIQYSFYSPSSKKYMHKASIVRVFKPFNWILGTGAYIDDVGSEMQIRALKAISNMKYGKNRYFWINDMEYKMLMHPIKPEFNNKKFINTPKVPFVELGVNQLKKSNKEADFIQYSFLTPATGKYSHKLSIVNQFKPWGWVIGTGVYTDHIEAEIQKKEQIIEEKINSIILKTIAIALFLLVVMSILVNFISSQIITKPIIEFQQGLLNFFRYLNKETSHVQPLELKSNDEIGSMVKIVNENITN